MMKIRVKSPCPTCQGKGDESCATCKGKPFYVEREIEEAWVELFLDMLDEIDGTQSKT